MDYHSPEGSTSRLAGMVPNPTDLSRRLESTQQEQQTKDNWSDDENSTATPSRAPNNSIPRVDFQTSTQLLETLSPSPTNRSPVNLQCCCGDEDCPNLAAFLRSIKSVEDQLRLAAEIGQALLQQQGVYQEEIKEYQQKLEHQCARYQQKIAELEDLVHDLESSQRTLSLEKDDATRQKNILENKSDALTEALESSDKRVVELTNELERLDNEVKRLMANHLLGERIEEREEMLSRQLEDLKQELQVSRKAEFAAESKVKKLQAKYDQLCINLEKLEKEQQGSRKSRGKLEAVAMLRESKSPQQNLNNEANSHLIALIKELSSANNKLKSEISEYRDLLSESRNEVSSLQNRIEDFETASTTGYFHPSSYATSAFQPLANDEMGENQPSSMNAFMEEPGDMSNIIPDTGDMSNIIPGTAARPIMSPNPSFGPGSYNTFNSLGVDPSVHSPVGSVVSSSIGNVFGELEKYYKKPKSRGPKIVRGPKRSRRGAIPEFDEKAEDQLNDENIAHTDAKQKKYTRSEGYESASGASDQCYNNEPNEE
ncbi:28480_t:CDS:2, partial [Racocetra persica]